MLRQLHLLFCVVIRLFVCDVVAFFVEMFYLCALCLLMKRMVKCSPEQAVDAGRAALDGGINVVRDAQLSCEPLM